MTSACEPCIRRAWLIGALSGHLEIEWRTKEPLRDILAMSDRKLIDTLGGVGRDALATRYDALESEWQLRLWQAANVRAICRHDARYPERLRLLADAPAILFCAGDIAHLEWVAGNVEQGPAAVSVVGTRRPLPEGDELAHGLGRGFAAAGVTVVSGMAMGIDSAAHAGALEVGGPTIAVLACGPERAYPQAKAALHRRLMTEQLVVAELPPGSSPRRWAFPARNRIIAALGRATIVVEAAQRSGSLITADFAMALGRDVGVAPGRAGSPRTRGGNGLLREGAAVILDIHDGLDLVLGSDRVAVAPAADRLEPELGALLARVAGGAESVGELAAAAADPQQVRVGLMELELRGLVRRMPGDRYVAVM